MKFGLGISGWKEFAAEHKNKYILSFSRTKTKICLLTQSRLSVACTSIFDSHELMYYSSLFLKRSILKKKSVEEIERYGNLFLRHLLDPSANSKQNNRVQSNTNVKNSETEEDSGSTLVPKKIEENAELSIDISKTSAKTTVESNTGVESNTTSESSKQSTTNESKDGGQSTASTSQTGVKSSLMRSSVLPFTTTISDASNSGPKPTVEERVSDASNLTTISELQSVVSNKFSGKFIMLYIHIDYMS